MENELSNQNRKQIRQLMESPSWAGFEAFFRVFREKNFINSSAKRSTEFDTIWYIAEQEGAKRILAQFVRELEEEVNKIND